MNLEKFREQIFLRCGMNLNIFKLPTQTQAAFLFMLFNWIECNNYSITIGPERRKILADYYSRSNDPNSRAVQNIFRGLTKSGLLAQGQLFTRRFLFYHKPLQFLKLF